MWPADDGGDGTTDGTRYLFGLTADARLARDGDVFRLDLSAAVDPHGNRPEFTHARQEGSDPPLAQAEARGGLEELPPGGDGLAPAGGRVVPLEGDEQRAERDIERT